MFSDILVDYLNRQPIQLGKPGKLFGEFAMKRAGVTEPSRVLFIGDMYVIYCISLKLHSLNFAIGYEN